MFFRSGFTLLEVLAAIVLVSLLALLATTSGSDARESAYASTMQSDLRGAATTYEVAHGGEGYRPIEDLGHAFSPRVFVLDEETGLSRWRLVIGHEGTEVVCMMDGGAGAEGRVRCSEEEGLSFTASTTTPEVGEGVVFDASESLARHARGFSLTAPLYAHGYSLVWHLGDGTSTPEMTGRVEHAYDAPGTYVVRLVARRGNEVLSASRTLRVGTGESADPSGAPVADFSATPEPALIAEPVTFDGSASSYDGGEIWFHDWVLDGETAGEGTILTHIFDAWGDYEVSLSVTADDGRTDTLSRMLEVRAHEPEASFTATPNPVRARESVTFDGSASRQHLGGIIAHDWDFGDWGFGSGEVLEHTFGEAGEYEVTLSVTGEGARTALVLGDVTVLANEFLARRISANSAHSCAIDLGDQAFCWGRNASGTLGDGSQASSTRPVPVSGGSRFAEIAVTQHATCALTTAGKAYCWGSNGHGRLGIGTDDSNIHPTPQPVATDQTFRAITGGASHFCALDTSGAAWCWGRNFYGNLGDGTTSTRLRPVRVAGGHVFDEIDSSFWTSCARTSSGEAFCWGYNSHGEVGDGSRTHRRTPVAVRGDHAFISISAGYYHTCGVDASGHAFCWGHRGNRVGTGATEHSSEPLPVLGGNTFASISAARNHTCGVTSSGEALCWGDNPSGQVGDGSAGEGRAEPTLVLAEAGFADVQGAGMSEYTCGIDHRQRAFCWGGNTEGRLGDGSTESRHAPTYVLPPDDGS